MPESEVMDLMEKDTAVHIVCTLQMAVTGTRKLYHLLYRYCGPIRKLLTPDCYYGKRSS